MAMQPKTFSWTIPQDRIGDWIRSASGDAFQFETMKDTELTCGFVQPLSVLRDFEVHTDCKGIWLIEFYVDGHRVLKEKLRSEKKGNFSSNTKLWRSRKI